MQMTSNILLITEPPTLLREQAFERLHSAIVTGYFAPGERLIERELCEAMGVSRTSIREVLRRLEAERLIQVEPRRGPTVARISRKQAEEIYEVRALLESSLVRRFTNCASEEDVLVLRGIFSEVKIAAENMDHEKLVSLMTRYNEHMNRVVDHEIIGDLLRQLGARISVLRVKSMSYPGRLKVSMHEIEEILDAIERRDSEGAAHCTIVCARNACAAALERMGL